MAVRGLDLTLHQLHVAKSKVVVLGNIPLLPQSGPICLAANTTNVQHCSGATKSVLSKFNRAEQLAAGAVGLATSASLPGFARRTARQWLGDNNVYLDQFHVTGTYSLVLENVLTNALGFSGTGR